MWTPMTRSATPEAKSWEARRSTPAAVERWVRPMTRVRLPRIWKSPPSMVEAAETRPTSRHRRASGSSEPASSARRGPKAGW